MAVVGLMVAAEVLAAAMAAVAVNVEARVAR